MVNTVTQTQGHALLLTDIAQSLIALFYFSDYSGRAL
jgi:hypothetical protein